MPTFKVACPRCGQKVSGDDSFLGTSVECPVCTAQIRFPKSREEARTNEAVHNYFEAPEPPPEPPVPPAEPPLELPVEAPPQGQHSHLPPSPHSLSLEEKYPEPEPDPIYRGERGRWEDDHDDDDDEEMSPLLGAISLVSGILGIVTCVGGILFAPLAVIFGHTALARARHSRVKPAPGQTLAVVGVILGYLTIIFLIAALISALLFGDSLKQWFGEQA